MNDGEPKPPDKPRASVVIRMRVHPTDLAEMSRLARAKGKPLSTWIRDQSLESLREARSKQRPGQRPWWERG